MHTTLSILRTLPLFEPLDAAALGDLAAVLDERRYRPGQHIVFEGDTSQGVFVILEGRVRLARTAADGREQVLDTAGPGELFNVVKSLLRPSPDYASLVRRGALVWAPFFVGFGQWRASTSAAGRAILQVTEFEPAASTLRHWIAGMVEETARRAIGTDAKVAITGGEMGFTPELTCEIT